MVQLMFKISNPNELRYVKLMRMGHKAKRSGNKDNLRMTRLEWENSYGNGTGLGWG